MQISVIGAGSWGTVLAQILNDNGHEVLLWARSKAKAAAIEATHCNADYLPQLKLDHSIHITNDLTLAVNQSQVLVFVVPSKAMAETAERISQINSCADKILLSCTKGFDPASKATMSSVLGRYLPQAKGLAVMSGPNLAGELALRQPGATVIASKEETTAEILQSLFLNNYFRPYTSSDLVGVELCGTLKNCMALVGGMICGLEYGDNCLAALITRGLAEIKRLGLALGAEEATFNGLAGMGDLIATCMSTRSRNHLAGEALARGKTLEEIQNTSKMVIEGIHTTKVAYNLGKEKNIELPIIEQLYAVLFTQKDVIAGLNCLMQREGKKE